MKETYPKPGQQKRVPRAHPTSEYPSWEKHNKRVVDAAVKWIVRDFVGSGQTYYMETDNFEWALRMAYPLHVHHHRVTLHGVDPSGAASLIELDRWVELLTKWKEREYGVPKQATGQSEGKGVRRILPGRDKGGDGRG